MKDSALRIAIAVEADIPAMVEISKASMGEKAWPAEVFRLYFRNNRSILAAWYKERTGCVVLVGYLAQIFESPNLSIEQLAVVADYRRCGIASNLIEQAASKINANTFSSIVATVDEYNLPAQMLLSSLGFLATVMTKGRRKTDHDSYTFEFALPQYAAGSR